MNNGIFRRTLVGAAVATAMGILATPAGAAPYRGTFDPTDFEGEYVIDVDPDCLAQATGWYANVGLCAATLTTANATVESSSPEPTYTGLLTFAPPAISNPSVLLGLYVYGGQLDSFDTTQIHHVGAAPSTIDDWWIQFVSGHMPLLPCDTCYGPVIGSQGVGLGKGVYLFANSQVVPVASAVFLGPAQAIPEPGTLSLLLGALGGGWLAQRRRKEKVPDPN